jgi:hypothetical protein
LPDSVVLAKFSHYAWSSFPGTDQGCGQVF